MKNKVRNISCIVGILTFGSIFAQTLPDLAPKKPTTSSFANPSSFFSSAKIDHQRKIYQDQLTQFEKDRRTHLQREKALKEMRKDLNKRGVSYRLPSFKNDIRTQHYQKAFEQSLIYLSKYFQLPFFFSTEDLSVKTIFKTSICNPSIKYSFILSICTLV